MKILFSEIAPKRTLGVTCFFNIVAPDGGHKIFDHQIGGGGHKNFAEVLSEIHKPPYSKENGGPLKPQCPYYVNVSDVPVVT